MQSEAVIRSYTGQCNHIDDRTRRRYLQPGRNRAIITSKYFSNGSIHLHTGESTYTQQAEWSTDLLTNPASAANSYYDGDKHQYFQPTSGFCITARTKTTVTLNDKIKSTQRHHSLNILRTNICWKKLHTRYYDGICKTFLKLYQQILLIQQTTFLPYCTVQRCSSSAQNHRQTSAASCRGRKHSGLPLSPGPRASSPPHSNPAPDITINITTMTNTRTIEHWYCIYTENNKKHGSLFLTITLDTLNRFL